MPNGLVFTGEYTNIKKRRLDILSKEIIYIFTRTMINGAEGCEIFLNNSKAYLFEFPPGVRDNLFKFIEENYKIKRYAFFGTKYNFFSSIVKASGGVIQKVSSDELYTQSKLSEAWETRKITTFTYLYYLNILAGRSFNDLCKYPIFPWVISDYNADELDILKMEIFRDLTRPIPFLKASRTDPKQSIHISNSNIVLNYLQRLEPYSSIRSNFQIDQSKCPPFDSILDTWNSIMNCPNDNRELIPEFYCNPLIFKSEKGDVALPKWAKNSPYIFVKGNRAALESEIVRKSLHKWIDMIFGIHLNALDVVANNPDLKPAYFGVLPQQILLQPQHPSCEPISYQFDENYKLPIKKVHRIRQGIVLTDDFKIVTSDGTKIKSPRITNLKFFEVSKQAKIAFYGSSFESYVNAVFFKDQEHVIMSHEAALVNSIAVVGLYLVTGTVEGTINRWRLPKLKTFPLLKTNFHRCPVVAIGGSVSMNTIVSLDIEGRLVYETLLYHGFLLTVKLKHSFPTNYIVVYKSGNVIVIQSSKNKSIISVLDMTGNIIKVREYSAFIQEYDKMYSTEKSDLLIIGYNSDTVEILDIPSLITIREYHGMIPNMRFSKAGKSKKHIKAFIASEIAILPMDVATKKI
ncbi:hypothetical protein TRFO_37971 [Tritrichomonas foetus]|uniref:BEACH domain-containing protein n=1 Tax=Tritrichomonas foetus TaxID=1144522 RepID=A0A1J4J9U1_9EUKA|nr:hypothetical protein TRFO_37971 [Tritrichomonas foetus]|eukprot:OHS95920.1 hypothetical protein TRFO_37971 [Tritrichomonas foetus]